VCTVVEADLKVCPSTALRSAQGEKFQLLLLLPSSTYAIDPDIGLITPSFQHYIRIGQLIISGREDLHSTGFELGNLGLWVKRVNG
jgi:hypothetical protein